MISTSSRRRQARDTRAVVEAALDMSGWKYSRALSLWIDAMLLLEESES